MNHERLAASTGIDFGTSNCTVSKWDGQLDVLALGSNRPASWNFPEFDKLFPSNFAVNDRARMFGWPAKTHLAGNLSAVKRLLAGNTHMDLGGRTYSSRHVAALLFASLRNVAASSGADFDSAVVTIPANSTGAARYRTRQAAKMAGIQVKALINEPTAAAMAYLAQFPDVERLFVYDWGGGTIDATLLEYRNGIYTERASRGIAGLGGLEIDKRLRELIYTSVPEAATYRGEEAAALTLELERTKIRLSGISDLDEQVPFVTPDGKFEVGVTRREFEAAIGFLVEKTMEPVQRALHDVGLESLDVDAVLMVGGSSQIPRVRERLARLLGGNDDPIDPVPTDIFDPMTAVSRGAAIAAAAMDGSIDVTFKVISGYALGTRTNLEDGRKVFSVVIPRGSALPARASKSYTPLEDHLKKLNVEIWEADPELPLEHEENARLAALTLVIRRPGPREEAKFLLEYRYDIDGVLNVKAIDEKTGKVLLHASDFFEGADEIDPEVLDVRGTFAPSDTSESRKAAPVPKPGPMLRPPRQVEKEYHGQTVVVDGSNIACHQIDIAGGGRPDYFQLRGAVTSLATTFPEGRVVVVVDANLPHKLSERDRVALDDDIKNGKVLMPPAGTVGAGDALILAIADRTNALVVSNDSYREFQAQYPWIRQGRILGASRAADTWFFVPRTPPQPKAVAEAIDASAISRPAAGGVTPPIVRRLPVTTKPGLPNGWNRTHWPSARGGNA